MRNLAANFGKILEEESNMRWFNSANGLTLLTINPLEESNMRRFNSANGVF